MMPFEAGLIGAFLAAVILGIGCGFWNRTRILAITGMTLVGGLALAMAIVVLNDNFSDVVARELGYRYARRMLIAYLFAPMVAIAAVPWLAGLKHRRRARTSEPVCDQCRYPLTGLSGPVCPECGTPINNPPA